MIFRQRSLPRRNGFTIIELLVVIVIIMILTTLGVSSYITANRNSRNGRRQADIAQLRAALEVYRATLGSYPSNGSPSAPTVTQYNNLIANPSFAPFLASTVVDPLNTGSYRYRYGGDPNAYSLCYFTEPSATQVCADNP